MRTETSACAVGSQRSVYYAPVALRHRAHPRWRWRAPPLAASSARQPQPDGLTSGSPGRHRRWAEARRALRSFACRGSAARGATARCPSELRRSAPRSRLRPAPRPPPSARAHALPTSAVVGKFCNCEKRNYFDIRVGGSSKLAHRVGSYLPAKLVPSAWQENVRAREGRLRVQGCRPALQDGGRCGAGAAPVRHLPRADAAVPRCTEPPREAAPRASNPTPCADHCRRSTERPTILARCRPRRWCQEDIKAWRKCFEEQRALDGRPVDSSDSPLQKARQKLDPAKYDKQGRPLK